LVGRGTNRFLGHPSPEPATSGPTRSGGRLHVKARANDLSLSSRCRPHSRSQFRRDVEPVDVVDHTQLPSSLPMTLRKKRLCSSKPNAARMLHPSRACRLSSSAKGQSVEGTMVVIPLFFFSSPPSTSSTTYAYRRARASAPRSRQVGLFFHTARAATAPTRAAATPDQWPHTSPLFYTP